jgi:hypothetical protein
MKDYYRTNEQEEEKEDPQPLTDEELAEFQQKENRKVGIIWTIIDFIVSFFH